MQDIKVGQIDRIVECLRDLIFYTGDLEAGKSRDEMRSWRFACQSPSSQDSARDHGGVRVLVEMLSQVREARPAFHLDGCAVDQEVETRRIARPGEIDVVTVTGSSTVGCFTSSRADP